MCSTNDKLVLNSIFNPLMPTTDDNDTASDDITRQLTAEEQLAKELETEAVNAANGSQYDRSLELLTRAIYTAPNRASCYNNRAQVYRVIGNTELALQDLNEAIRLSSGTGLVARQAYCQRGLIHLLHKREAEGIEDMKLSANLGNDFAKALVVQLNPYAALCNKMLRDMINKCIIGGETGDQ
ncbi:tetratricopeptide repeat protein 36 homolog [Oppia nitens]|uniref:tetratricopeptide repeat protein 36 homolog n=1 Tax=Oppia nitens TaxID=1686743 RepID=UPI0023DB9FAB|nr:tetratricopeptide repeat protein 36 homolog [Oppia nitens]